MGKNPVGRPRLKRTEPLYFRVDPETKDALYEVQNDLTPDVGSISLTDTVVYLIWKGVEVHRTQKNKREAGGPAFS